MKESVDLCVNLLTTNHVKDMWLVRLNYRGAGKSLARPGIKQAIVSVRMT